MILAAFALAGALLGAFLARRRGGRGLDIAQYAVSSALVFSIIGLFVTLAVLS